MELVGKHTGIVYTSLFYLAHSFFSVCWPISKTDGSCEHLLRQLYWHSTLDPDWYRIFESDDNIQGFKMWYLSKSFLYRHTKMISPTVTEDFPLNKSLLRYYDNSVCLLVIISHKLPVYSPPDSASCHVCGIASTCCWQGSCRLPHQHLWLKGVSPASSLPFKSLYIICNKYWYWYISKRLIIEWYICDTAHVL